MARRRAQQIARTRVRRRERRRGPVHAGASPRACVGLAAIQKDAGAMRAREGEERLAKRALTRQRPVLLAQLDELQSAVERDPRACEKRGFSDIARHRDAADRRQRQRAQHERVGRQQRRDVEGAGDLPRERLPVVADGLAVPIEDAEEMELDVRMRIDEALDEPRRRAANGEAQLLGELAVERVARRFAGLELAARELPVAGIGLAASDAAPAAPCRRAA